MARTQQLLATVAVLGVAACSLVLPSEKEISGGKTSADGGVASTDASLVEASVDGNTDDARGVTFVTSASASAADASAVVVTLPEAPREGDVLVAIVYDGLAEASTRSSVTPPDGWNKQISGGYWWTFYGVAGANAPTTYTFTMSKAGSFGWPFGAAAMAAYRGVDTVNPIADAKDVERAAQTAGTQSSGTIPSVDVARSGSMLVLLMGADGSNLGPAWTVPSDMVEHVDLGYVALADGLVPTTGATGSKSFAHVETGWSSYLNVIALAPRD